MKKNEKAIAIAVARQNLAAAQAIVEQFNAAFSEVNFLSDEFAPVRDAWNAAHDMVSSLEGAEHRIEQADLFDKIVASGQYESYRLAAQNID